MSISHGPFGLEILICQTVPAACYPSGGRGSRLARCLVLSSNRAARSTASAAASWAGLELLWIVVAARRTPPACLNTQVRERSE
jgi:hypothetical protein